MDTPTGAEALVRMLDNRNLDIRLQTVRAKFEKDLVARQRVAGPDGNGPEACVRVDLGRIEVSDIFAHDAYLRLYIKATASTSAYLPCPK